MESNFLIGKTVILRHENKPYKIVGITKNISPNDNREYPAFIIVNTWGDFKTAFLSEVRLKDKI